MAEVAVKSEFKNGVTSPLRLQIGSIKRNVPTKIRIKKLETITIAGLWNNLLDAFSFKLCFGILTS